MELLFFISPTVYWMQLLYLLVGCLVLGVGVYMEMLADVVMLPGESFVRSIVFRWKTEFGSTKLAFDVSMTVIAAILVGFIARKFPFIPELLFGTKSAKTPVSATTHFFIAIDRQYGSGGHDFGEALEKNYILISTTVL